MERLAISITQNVILETGRVLMEGKPVELVVWCDSEEGWADILVTDQEGVPIVNEQADLGYETIRILGVTEIVHQPKFFDTRLKDLGEDEGPQYPYLSGKNSGQVLQGGVLDSERVELVLQKEPEELKLDPEKVLYRREFEEHAKKFLSRSEKAGLISDCKNRSQKDPYEASIFSEFCPLTDQYLVWFSFLGFQFRTSIPLLAIAEDQKGRIPDLVIAQFVAWKQGILSLLYDNAPEADEEYRWEEERQTYLPPP